ncbi:MAG: hypothetical protein AAF108_08250 [Planctomycetota bacterium]
MKIRLLANKTRLSVSSAFAWMAARLSVHRLELALLVVMCYLVLM